MRRSRAVRWARWTLVLASAFVLALLGASCRDVLGIEDGYQDGVDALCAIVGRCTAEPTDGCSTRIHDRFTADEQLDPWSQWLSSLGARQCLDGCVGARRCLDDQQVCVTVDCTTKEQCCGFLSGRVECDAEEKRCCAPEGNKCVTDDDCCSDARPCSKVSFTCGGVVCRPTGDTCVNSFECCSKVCRDSKCAQEICGEDGFECSSDADCCDGFCKRSENANVGVCGASECGILGDSCVADAECCAGTFCGKLDPADPTGLCSTCPTAYPDGTDCGVASQCCSGSCDKNFYQCGKLCAPQNQECKTNEDCCDGVCDPSTDTCKVECPTSCTVNADCCTDECIGGQCKPACDVPKTCTHDLCSIGSPLKDTCEVCDNPADCTLKKECIQAVCAIDDFCCCNAWDSLCVSEVQQEIQKNGACSDPCKG